MSHLFIDTKDDEGRRIQGYYSFREANDMVVSKKWEYMQVCCWGYVLRERMNLERGEKDVQ